METEKVKRLASQIEKGSVSSTQVHNVSDAIASVSSTFEEGPLSLFLLAVGKGMNDEEEVYKYASSTEFLQRLVELLRYYSQGRVSFAIHDLNTAILLVLCEDAVNLRVLDECISTEDFLQLVQTLAHSIPECPTYLAQETQVDILLRFYMLHSQRQQKEKGAGDRFALLRKHFPKEILRALDDESQTVVELLDKGMRPLLRIINASNKNISSLRYSSFYTQVLPNDEEQDESARGGKKQTYDVDGELDICAENISFFISNVYSTSYEHLVQIHIADDAVQMRFDKLPERLETDLPSFASVRSPTALLFTFCLDSPDEDALRKARELSKLALEALEEKNLSDMGTARKLSEISSKDVTTPNTSTQAKSKPKDITDDAKTTTRDFPKWLKDKGVAISKIPWSELWGRLSEEGWKLSSGSKGGMRNDYFLIPGLNSAKNGTLGKSKFSTQNDVRKYLQQTVLRPRGGATGEDEEEEGDGEEMEVEEETDEEETEEAHSSEMLTSPEEDTNKSKSWNKRIMRNVSSTTIVVEKEETKKKAQKAHASSSSALSSKRKETDMDVDEDEGEGEEEEEKEQEEERKTNGERKSTLSKSKETSKGGKTSPSSVRSSGSTGSKKSPVKQHEKQQRKEEVPVHSEGVIKAKMRTKAPATKQSEVEQQAAAATSKKVTTPYKKTGSKRGADKSPAVDASPPANSARMTTALSKKPYEEEDEIEETEEEEVEQVEEEEEKAQKKKAAASKEQYKSKSSSAKPSTRSSAVVVAAPAAAASSATISTHKPPAAPAPQSAAVKKVSTKKHAAAPAPAPAPVPAPAPARAPAAATAAAASVAATAASTAAAQEREKEASPENDSSGVNLFGGDEDHDEFGAMHVDLGDSLGDAVEFSQEAAMSPSFVEEEVMSGDDENGTLTEILNELARQNKQKLHKKLQRNMNIHTDIAISQIQSYLKCWSDGHLLDRNDRDRAAAFKLDTIGEAADQLSNSISADLSVYESRFAEIEEQQKQCEKDAARLQKDLTNLTQSFKNEDVQFQSDLGKRKAALIDTVKERSNKQPTSSARNLREL